MSFMWEYITMNYILTADLHFQYTIPICRKDNFLQTQINKMEWLETIRKKYDGIILCAGDITHRAREDKQNEFLNMLISHMPKIYGVAGNHDLLSHQWDNIYKSAIGVLINTNKYNIIENNNPLSFNNTDDIIYGFNWGTELSNPLNKGKNSTIALWHKMILAPNDNLTNYVDGINSNSLLDKFPEYDLILTGDNHKTFIIEKDNRFLINPGSFLRLTSSQKDFKPSIFIYNSINKTIEQIFIPIEKNIISDEHINKKESIDFDAYIEQLQNKESLNIDFKENIYYYLKNNKTPTKIETKLLQFIGV